MGDYGCPGCRYFQSSTTPGKPSYITPSGNWVVTQWSTTVGTNPVLPTQIKLLMLENAGGNNFTLRVQDTQDATATQAVNTFDVRIPVEGGWYLGLDTGTGGHTCVEPGSSVGDIITAHQDKTVGNTTQDTATFNGCLLNISARLESDFDDDGFGDETQDACSTDATKQAECDPPETTITREPKDKSSKPSAKYKFISDEPGSTFECKIDKKPFKPCASPKKFKVKDGKHTFLVRAIDPAGNVDPTADKDKFKVVD